MKILFLSDNFPPEGNAPATRTWEHVRRWAQAGHEITVVTCAPNFPDGKVFGGYDNRWRQIEEIDGVRVVRVKTYISANSGTVKRIADYLSFMASASLFSLFERSPDVVVATSPQFFTAVAGFFVSKAKRRPFVLEIRDLWPASIVAVNAMKRSAAIDALERLELFLYDQADKVIVVTESFKEDLVRRDVPPDKVSVVFNGVDQQLEPVAAAERQARELGLHGKFVVAYMGTHGMAHALDKVLDTAKLLSHRKDIAFLFVGSGAAKAQLEERTRELGLKNVVLLPRQEKSTLPGLWSMCSLGLVPLRDDPVFRTVIPSKIFELGALGIPILMALPEGEATRLVSRFDAGELIPPEDPAAMAEAIEGLHSKQDRLRQLRQNGKKLAERFSRDDLASQMLEELQGAARRSRGS